MRTRGLAIALVCLFALPASASAWPRGQFADTCAPAGQQAEALCYGGDVLQRDAEAYATPGRFDAAMTQYERSWTHRALGLQYELANDVPFVNAPWVGTHNSFNSIAQQGPALSTTDSNQQLTLRDQLRLDMRSLELDVHWFPSVHAGGQNAAVVCHAGAASDHDGCSTEPLLGPVLDQVATWLRAHRDQVLLLYVEDHLDGGYDSAAATIHRSLDGLVYETGWKSGDCVDLPGTLTRQDVLDAGAQVVIVSGCGSGSAWRGIAHTWRTHEEGGARGFRDFPDCGPDYTRATYESRLIRYYEDSTWLTAGADAATGAAPGDGLTEENVARMMRCGVDLLGFDQIVPGDPRLRSLVWSWAEGQPAAGNCALVGQGGRWSSSSCAKKRRAACRRADGSWLLTDDAVKPKSAGKACASEGAAFSVPRTGYENASLELVTRGTTAWLGYTRTRYGWTAADADSR